MIKIKSLFVDHLFGHAAIHQQVDAVDEIIGRVTEEQTGVYDILRLTHPTRGMLLMIDFSQLLVSLHLNPPRADGVDRDTGTAQGDAQTVGEGDQPTFGCTVGFSTGFILMKAG